MPFLPFNYPRLNQSSVVLDIFDLHSGPASCNVTQYYLIKASFCFLIRVNKFPKEIRTVLVPWLQSIFIGREYEYHNHNQSNSFNILGRKKNPANPISLRPQMGKKGRLSKAKLPPDASKELDLFAV